MDKVELWPRQPVTPFHRVHARGRVAAIDPAKQADVVFIDIGFRRRPSFALNAKSRMPNRRKDKA
ncbi:MAG: hypothetical protein Q4D92_05980, partial [Slackia sp.]|nr:hypothetical protein [Slackia sp.]